ncbi:MULTISPECIES: secondary thiamine-phosphate synthase enzyme YjbQ [Caproicibacterium]|uniref:Secondary thiamine-phosphate synthase enzyme YjbQ n=1 Tax=Caproicibacterium argilliputei TaxID=3030016 RepID=A0AA97DA26_9FIRM|nr:secondary thiamine-phosphate synthase enzyme YjbQ [Caproicibacterium argilliputei]WOC31596.1 secondary thiamine-phosphate synthase enzyme YjbQ [Caproicibacterium argilliputei]
MLYSYELETGQEGFYEITEQVQESLQKSSVDSGICLVYCVHTTAAVTINENADPDVVHDLLWALDKTFPNRPEFRHREGNSAAHLKSSVIGCSVSVPILEGHLALGTWQGIYFCEFDGPRHRHFTVQILS